MNKLLIVVGFSVLLGGCASLGPAYEAGQAKGAEAMDYALGQAEWVICNAASVGSVRRRYGTDTEMATTWARLCTASQPAAWVPVGK